MARYYSVAETATEIRKALKEAFASQKFSVKSKSYSGGASIRIEWRDGPTTKQVEAVVGRFSGASFDGMQDLKIYTSDQYKGEEVRWGADYVFTERDYSPEALNYGISAAAAKNWSHWTGVEIVKSSYTTGKAKPVTHTSYHLEHVDEAAAQLFFSHHSHDLRMMILELLSDHSFLVETAPHSEPDQPQSTDTSDAQTLTGEAIALEVTHNTQRNGVELRFSAKPSQSVLELLGNHPDFHYSRRQNIWYAQYTDETMAFAQHLQSTLAEAPESDSGLVSEGDDDLLTEIEPEQLDEQVCSSGSIKTANKLRDLADGLQAKIDHCFAHRSENTARKRRIAASVRSDGRQAQKVQTVLRVLAAMHEAGAIDPLLAKITTRKFVEWALLRCDYSHDDLIRFLDYQSDLAAVYKKQFGLSSNSELVSFIWQVQSLVQLDQEQQTVQIKEQRMQDLRSEILEIQHNIAGYFPSPTPTAEQVVQLAQINPGDRVLEPSAGSGHIAKVVRDRHPSAQLTCVEFNLKLRQMLELENLNVSDERDFLEFAQQPENQEAFDRVVMNPPWGREYRQFGDIEHVMAAYRCLKPGGRLVAIMGEGTFFNHARVATEFRSFLLDLGATDLNLGSAFADSDRPTNVRCRIVMLTKPAIVESTVQPIAELPLTLFVEAKSTGAIEEYCWI